jgi:hypothetical protein
VAVGLDQADVRRTLSIVLAAVPAAEFRLVGTASCVLRGIAMPASDVDVLFRDRKSVDAWAVSLATVANVTDDPRWLGDVAQYFARVVVDEVTVELSTVELAAETDAAECVGVGPWAHFDSVPCGEFSVPAVALELRLVTEVLRQRVDRWQPIVDYLETRPCDIELVERGLRANSTPPDAIAAIVASLNDR